MARDLDILFKASAQRDQDHHRRPKSHSTWRTHRVLSIRPRTPWRDGVTHIQHVHLIVPWRRHLVDGTRGSPAGPKFFLTWVFSHVCSAGLVLEKLPRSAVGALQLSATRLLTNARAFAYFGALQQQRRVVYSKRPLGDPSKCCATGPANPSCRISNRAGRAQ